jgi:hypothetical protein
MNSLAMANTQYLIAACGVFWRLLAQHGLSNQ